ncbi:MAG: ATP-binding protein [Gammaproteobacteria bacterium]
MSVSETLKYSPLSLNLQRLFWLRNIAIAAQLVVIAWVHVGLEIPLPLKSMVFVIALLALFNVFAGLRLRRRWPVTDAEIFAQLLVDVAALTALLFYSGGATNPFISLYLLPLIIVATTLPRIYTWAMAGITAACYSVLMFYSAPLAAHANMQEDFSLHLLGMWFNFLLSAALITFFIAKMATTLRERERVLANFREESLRNERIVALGVLATGAAHELSTPLTTMAVITEDLEQTCAHLPEVAGDVRCLRAQIAICKTTLTHLLASSGHARAAQTTSFLSLESFLNEMLGQWQLMRPAVPVISHWAGTQPAPRIIAEPALGQTLLNLLNNAADASPGGVEMEGSWDDKELIIEIRDRGPGITPEVAERAIQPFFTTKAPGHNFGLGLFLANATVERLGGKVRLFNRIDGGACTRVTLPLSMLLVPV